MTQSFCILKSFCNLFHLSQWWCQRFQLLWSKSMVVIFVPSFSHLPLLIYQKIPFFSSSLKIHPDSGLFSTLIALVLSYNHLLLYYCSSLPVMLFICTHPCELSGFNCVFVTPWTVAHQAPLSMGFPDTNIGVGSHALLRGIFLTQGSNLGLQCCRWILYRWAIRSARIHPYLCILNPADKLNLSKYKLDKITPLLEILQ